MFKNKCINVYIIDNAELLYFELKQKVDLELRQRSFGTKWQTLFSSIENKKEELQKNPFYGVQIPKNLIPRIYIERYDVENLWKCNLSLAWRAIYFIKGERERIFVSIVGLVDHSTYDKIFGYRKR